MCLPFYTKYPSSPILPFPTALPPNAKRPQVQQGGLGERCKLQWRGHGEGGFGKGGLNPPLSSGATHEICAEPTRKYWGTPPRNTPGLKSPQLHGASLDPPQLLCPWTPLGTPLHTPRHVPLVSHLLQNSARTNSQNDHLIIKFVTNHYICNKCNNEVNFYRKSAY